MIWNNVFIHSERRINLVYILDREYISIYKILEQTKRNKNLKF